MTICRLGQAADLACACPLLGKWAVRLPSPLPCPANPVLLLLRIMGVKTFVSPSEDVFRASAGSMGIEAFVKVRAALHAGTAALLWNSA